MWLKYQSSWKGQIYRGLCQILRPRLQSPLHASAGFHSTSKLSVKLREYQEECIESVLQNLQDGKKRLGISLATGSGKTVILTHLIDRVRASNDTKTQTLIIVHRRELVEQAARHCADAYPAKTIEIEMGTNHATGTADITVASILSLISSDRLSKFDPHRFKLIMVDEAHHIAAASYTTVLRHFELLKEQLNAESPALVGVSATFSRFDGVRLSDAIDYIVYHKDYINMIEEKWLAHVVFTTVSSGADLSRVRSGSTGDFQTGQLSKAVNTIESNQITLKAWQEKASERRSTLIFCVDRNHVSQLTDTFRRAGIDARNIVGITRPHVRRERLEQFRLGSFPVLINCQVLTEGTDIPGCDCIVLARPTKSRNLLVQMIGRGMRLHPEKHNCHVIDMVASLNTGIVTTPTLFGLDPNSVLSNDTVVDIKAKVKDQDARETAVGRAVVGDGPAARSLKFTNYDSVYDLIADTSSERRIRQISALSWVVTGSACHILSFQDGSYLALEETDSDDGITFKVIFTERMSDWARAESNTKSPYRRPREIASASSFSDAVHAADTFATRKSQWRYTALSQPWRKAPATEAQLAFLNKMRPAKDQRLRADSVTKGRAADMIQKIKFGARGLFGAQQASKKRQHKAEAVAGRERVMVGPLT